MRVCRRILVATVLAMLFVGGCGIEAIGSHHYRGTYVDSITLNPAAALAGSVAEVTVGYGQDDPPWMTSNDMTMPLKLDVTAGSLYLTEAEAQAGERDIPFISWGAYGDGDLRKLQLDGLKVAYWQLPDNPGKATITADYWGITRRLDVLVSAP